MSSENLKPCVECGALIDKKSKVCPECGEKRPFLKKLKLKPLDEIRKVNYAQEVLSIAVLRLVVSVILIFIFPLFKVSQTAIFINFVVYAASAYGLYYKRRWAFVVIALYSLIGILLNVAYGEYSFPYWDLLMIYYAYKGYKEYDIDEIMQEEEVQI